MFLCLNFLRFWDSPSSSNCDMKWYVYNTHASTIPACSSTAQKDVWNSGAPSPIVIVSYCVHVTKMKALKRVQDDRKAKEAKSLWSVSWQIMKRNERNDVAVHALEWLHWCLKQLFEAGVKKNSSTMWHDPGQKTLQASISCESISHSSKNLQKDLTNQDKQCKLHVLPLFGPWVDVDVHVRHVVNNHRE